MMEVIPEIITSLGILAGIYFALRRSRNSDKQVEVTERGQVTQRFTAAIKQLGDRESSTIRVGGIYALEQIARDAPEAYHWTVCEVLCSFIREERPRRAQAMSQAEVESVGDNGEEQGDSPIPIGIQAALTVLGRFRNEEREGGRRLNLRETNLRGANLSGADFSGADFSGADMRGANLSRASLREAYLSGADLGTAEIFEADLSEADLSSADLSGAVLFESNLSEVDLFRANLSEADLGAAQNLTQCQLDQAFGNPRPRRIPEGLTSPPLHRRDEVLRPDPEEPTQ